MTTVARLISRAVPFARCPTHQYLSRWKERSAAEELCKSPGRRPRPAALEHREEPEDCGRLLDRGFRVGAVAGVPAERGSAEAPRFLGEDQKGELEGFGEPDVLEFGGGSPGGEEVAVVERPAEASIG
jgi:hypothetical protein